MLDSGFVKAILIIFAVLSDMLTSGRVEGSSTKSSSGHVNVAELVLQTFVDILVTTISTGF